MENPRADRISQLLGSLDGAKIPGGCEHCDAYQTMTLVAEGVHKVTVHHDDWCPRLRGEES